MKWRWLMVAPILLVLLAACGTITSSKSECDEGLCIEVKFNCDQSRDVRVSVNIQANSSKSPPIPVKFVTETTAGVYIDGEEGEVGKNQDTGTATSPLAILQPAHDEETYKIKVFRDNKDEEERTIYLEPDESCQDGDTPI